MRDNGANWSRMGLGHELDRRATRPASGRRRTLGWGGLIAFLCVAGWLLRGSRTRTARCNPFAALGTLHIDLDNTAATRWLPFDQEKCPSSHLSGDLREAVYSSASASELRAAFPWLNNRTVIKIGDSVDREQLDCASPLQVGAHLTTRRLLLGYARSTTDHRCCSSFLGTRVQERSRRTTHQPADLR